MWKMSVRQQNKRGIKLRADKCDLVCYLGKSICSEDYRMVFKEIVVVRELVNRPPTNMRELRKLLAFLGYYSYVQNFSQHAKCLYDLLAVKSETPASGKRRTVVAMQLPHQKVKWEDGIRTLGECVD
jgi:hypothetical protein